MRVILSAAFAMAILISGQALADNMNANDTKPFQLSAAELDKVTAGVGANNVATQPWPALKDEAGFDLHHLLAADNGALNPNNDHLLGVAVPSAVPGSVLIAD